MPGGSRPSSCGRLGRELCSGSTEGGRPFRWDSVPTKKNATLMVSDAINRFALAPLHSCQSWPPPTRGRWGAGAVCAAPVRSCQSWPPPTRGRWGAVFFAGIEFGFGLHRPCVGGTTTGSYGPRQSPLLSYFAAPLQIEMHSLDPRGVALRPRKNLRGTRRKKRLVLRNTRCGSRTQSERLRDNAIAL